MEKFLLQRLMEPTKEERDILAGASFDPSHYFSGNALIKSERMIEEKKREIGIKTHTRFVAFPEHGHNYVEMMIVLSGSITHKIAERTVKLGEGDILLLNKHARHSIERAGRGDLGVNILMTDRFVNALSPELADTVFSGFIKDNAKPDGRGAYLHFSGGGHKAVENLLENIIFELTDTEVSTAILSRTLALLFCSLAEKPGMLTEASTPDNTEADRRAKICAYIKANYRTASLSELGDTLFLSTPYLSKLISEYFGKGFKKLLLEERLRRADLLITATQMPISEIIRSVGYENESYFHKEYKQKYGVTPFARRGAKK